MAVATAPAHVMEMTTTINAPMDQVWAAWTNRDDICDWLCFDAQVNASEGGYYFLRWYEGPRAYGNVLHVTDHEKIKFTWQDETDFAPSKVKVMLSQDGDAVQITVKHIDLESEDAVQHYNDFWEPNLNRLKVGLETGVNTHISERVVIGIYPSTLTDDDAKRLGVPVTNGARVGTVIPGYSAAAAGIQEDDVIVAVDGRELDEETTIHAITGEKKPGDGVDVTYYRGPEKHTVSTELRGYPVPPIPASFSAMADAYEKQYKETLHALKHALKDAGEDDADKKAPSGGQTIRERLAHIILRQRHTRDYLATYLNGPRLINPYTEENERIQALIDAYDTLEGLFGALAHAQAESVSLLRQFPEAYNQRKNYLWWITFETNSAADVLLQHDLETITGALNA